MKTILTYMFCCCAGLLQAQELGFSQPFTTPFNLNPAFVGAINAKNRVIIQYKYSEMPTKINSSVVSFDHKYALNARDYIGIGVYMGQQDSADLNKTITKLAVAYGKYLGETAQGSTHYLVASGEAAYLTNRLSLANYYTATGGNAPLAIDGMLRKSFTDMSIGAMWYAAWKKGKRAHVGLTWQHLNKPTVGFFEPTILPFRYILHTGCELPLKPQLRIVPTVIINRQGVTTEMCGGLALKLTNQDTLSIKAGVFIRYGNSFTPKPAPQSASVFFRIDSRLSAISFAFEAPISEFATNRGLEIAYSRLFGAPDHKNKTLIPVW
jgi:type IX secretion system PorP/SprF family membrane protein